MLESNIFFIDFVYELAFVLTGAMPLTTIEFLEDYELRAFKTMPGVKEDPKMYYDYLLLDSKLLPDLNEKTSVSSMFVSYYEHMSF